MNVRSLSRIYLLRHARSAWAQPGERDFERPLDDEGFAEAEIVADRAADLGYRPKRIVSSTALRCRQTADAMHRALNHDLELTFADELYNASDEIYVEIIASTYDVDSLMLIGHNPTIEEVLERLTGHNATAAAIPTGYPTAGLAVLDRPSSSKERYWSLVDFLTA